MACTFLRTGLDSVPELNLERPLFIGGAWRAPLSDSGYCDVIDAQ